MIIEGRLAIQAPIEKLWDALLEPETLQACVPGAEDIRRTGETAYEGVIRQKVGPISVRFKFQAHLEDLDPPRHMVLTGEGEDVGMAGRVTQKTTIDLTETDAGKVEVAYRCNASVVGKLAVFGDRVMQAKAKKLESEFSRALQETLAGGVSGAGPDPA